MPVKLVNALFVLFRLFFARSTADYIEYQPSTGFPVVITAPHGGQLQPTDIPDRDVGCWNGSKCVWTHDCRNKDPSRCSAVTTTDLYTAQMAMEIAGELRRRCGKNPATIICALSRKKLDANREVGEATFGVPAAVKAYNEYHGHIRAESAQIVDGQRGLLLDIHGHGHDIQRAELGYLLSAKQLNLNSDLTDLANDTCIFGLYGKIGGSFDDLLRGEQSFGGILEAQGFESVPSPTNKGPGSAPYFSGGYTVLTHGSMKGGNMDAIQIESPKSFRDANLRTKYVQAIASTVVKFLKLYNDFEDCTFSKI